jgi:hypothetical protein
MDLLTAQTNAQWTYACPLGSTKNPNVLWTIGHIPFVISQTCYLHGIDANLYMMSFYWTFYLLKQMSSGHMLVHSIQWLNPMSCGHIYVHWSHWIAPMSSGHINVHWRQWTNPMATGTYLWPMFPMDILNSPLDASCPLDLIDYYTSIGLFNMSIGHLAEVLDIYRCSGDKRQPNLGAPRRCHEHWVGV